MGVSIVLKKLLLGRAFSTEKGRIKLFEKMDWTMVPSRSLAKNFQDIAEKKGGSYLYNLGFESGVASREQIIKHMNLKSKSDRARQIALTEMMEFVGFGRSEFILLKVKRDGRHHIVFKVRNNAIVEHAAKLFREKSMVCNWFAGFYAAHSVTELGIKNPKVRERKCICRGAPHCELETRW
jgi:predicted hydrocarbon binding protein